MAPTDDDALCDTAPDADIAGLGVRLGLWLQCAALAVSLASGESIMPSSRPAAGSRTAALAAALLVALVYDVVLSMKMAGATNPGGGLFGAYPVVQDLWVAQGQLWLVVVLPLWAVLFSAGPEEEVGEVAGGYGAGERAGGATGGVDRTRQRTSPWRALWRHKTLLLYLCIFAYTTAQALFFWLAGWRRSDEALCGVDESTFASGRVRLFADGGRWAMVALYGVGCAMLLAALGPRLADALTPSSRGRRRLRSRRGGLLAWAVPKRRIRRYWARAAALAATSAPLFGAAIFFVEATVRRGHERQWTRSTGQWLALGVGVGTLAESCFAFVRAAAGEQLRGAPFAEDLAYLGGRPAGASSGGGGGTRRGREKDGADAAGGGASRPGGGGDFFGGQSVPLLAVSRVGGGASVSSVATFESPAPSPSPYLESRMQVPLQSV